MRSGERASRFLAFDAAGAPMASAGPAGDSAIPVSAFIETLLDDADAAAARATLGIDLDAIGAAIAAAVAGAVPTGTVQPTIAAAAPAGWLLLNGDSIGGAGSGADHADEALEALFALFWNDWDDAAAPVSGGRGASAAADWAAGKTLTLPDARGRALIGAGTGAGLTARALGETLGEEEHTLTVGEMPAHTHTQVGASVTGLSSAGGGDVNTNSVPTNTGSAGGDEGHNNMQPSLATNWMVKV